MMFPIPRSNFVAAAATLYKTAEVALHPTLWGTMNPNPNSLFRAFKSYFSYLIPENLACSCTWVATRSPFLCSGFWHSNLSLRGDHLRSAVSSRGASCKVGQTVASTTMRTSKHNLQSPHIRTCWQMLYMHRMITIYLLTSSDDRTAPFHVARHRHMYYFKALRSLRGFQLSRFANSDDSGSGWVDCASTGTPSTTPRSVAKPRAKRASSSQECVHPTLFWYTSIHQSIHLAMCQLVFFKRKRWRLKAYV